MMNDPMNGDERRLVRQALIVVGAKRSGFTAVDNEGTYDEVWTHGSGTTVTIQWRKIPAVAADTPEEEIGFRTFLYQYKAGSIFSREAISQIVEAAGPLARDKRTRTAWTALIEAGVRDD